jgi:hypothetical protein
VVLLLEHYSKILLPVYRPGPAPWKHGQGLDVQAPSSSQQTAQAHARATESMTNIRFFAKASPATPEAADPTNTAHPASISDGHNALLLGVTGRRLVMCDCAQRLLFVEVAGYSSRP